MASSLSADTPEKIDQPDALRQSIPRLREQDPWTKFATPEQIRLYDVPETDWPEIPADQYDLSGFDASILGSKLPLPGVHPRVLFNQEDLPKIRERLFATPAGQREFALTEYILRHTMLDPSQPDGKAFAKLAAGDLEGLSFGDAKIGANGNHMFTGYKPGIYGAHVCYWPRNLASLAFYALVKGDEALSGRTAVAVHSYYKLREPLIDAQNDRAKDSIAADSWPSDLWRGMHVVAGEAHLGIAYDLCARYMNAEQKTLLRRVIAKATAGKRSYSANGPLRWRDTNWTGWDTQLLLCHLAVEGEEGYDAGVYQAERDSVRAYLTFGISPYGTIFETNGKNGAGLHFALTSSVALARRGDNYLGHPHLRKMTTSQVHQVVPAGGRNVNNGTYGCGPFGNAGFLKNLYPHDLAADWLIQEGRPLDEDDRQANLAAYRTKLETNPINWRRRHPLTADTYLELAAYAGAKSPAGEARATWQRDYLGLPLDFEDPQHGQLCTRSGNGRDALFLMVEARPDLYTGGHQHHDAGHFYLSAHGVDWGVESDHGARDSAVHSVVLIDGKGQGDTQHCAPAKARWLGAVINEHGALARTDLKHAYDYIWTTPMHYSWNHEERQRFHWEPETDPEVVKIFRGTQHWKDRIWAGSYWDNNWGPTMRGSYNPVEYAYRTAGIVRGLHPYGVIVDDVRKDSHQHQYQWQMQVPGEVRRVEGPAGMILLGVGGQRTGGEPLLCVMPVVDSSQALVAHLEAVELGKIKGQRLVLTRQGIEGRFRILLIPIRSGEALPRCVADGGGSRVSLAWKDQSDALAFTPKLDGRTRLVVQREAKTILEVK